MRVRSVSDGGHLGIKYPLGYDAPASWWLSADSWPLFPTHTGDNSAGNGGNGYFAGSLIGKSYAAFEPLNVAQAGSHATADAYQTNIAYFDQSATQIAGIGGNGGNGNAALGGNVGAFGSVGPGAIDTGDNSAGNGGDGTFFGALVHAPVAVHAPVSIAVAGYNSSAHADQTNNVVFDQSAFQMAGVGGDGGNGNHATGGSADIFSSIFDLIGSDAIATGNNGSGNGGNGHFSGSMVDIDVAIYAPINIAIAGYNSAAEAHQSNNVHFDQSTVQMAGIGGDGGHGNGAFGGDLAMHLHSGRHQHQIHVTTLGEGAIVLHEFRARPQPLGRLRAFGRHIAGHGDLDRQSHALDAPYLTCVGAAHHAAAAHDTDTNFLVGHDVSECSYLLFAF